MSRKRIQRFTLATIVVAVVGVAHASTRTWPGAAPCTGTLQACLDASANGDRIEIASDTIAEDISLYDMDRTLAPAPGFRPAFGPGHWLSITSSTLSGDRSVSVSGLSFVDGYVFASYQGIGTANYDLSKLILNRASLDTANYIRVRAESGTLNASVRENRIVGVPAATLQGMITLQAQGGTLEADAYYNRVECPNAELTNGAGILATYEGSGSSGGVRLHGNEVRGSFAFGSILASEGLGSGTAASFDARVYNNVVVGTGAAGSMGIRYLVNTGTIDAQTVANTVTRVDWGISAGPYSGAAPAARIDGLVSSNLVRAGLGLFIDAAHAPALTNDYNLVNASANLATLGAHTITADARVVSDAMPRLRGDSPAIDAADTATVGLGMLFAGLPNLDADGMRRIKTWFSPDRIDIGAYEYGDAGFAHVTTAANTSAHVTHLHDPAIDGVATAHLQVTQHPFPHGASTDHPFGTWLDGSTWTVFAEDITALPVGMDYDIFSPAPGAGAFRHAADASNTAVWQTRIDDTSVNDLPDRMLFVTQDYGASAVYNPHEVGVRYVPTSTSTGDWYIVNLDRTAAGPVPVGAGFSVYAQAASPNAFRVTKVAGVDGSSTIPLDHPLLDGVACAQPIVTRVDTGTAVAGGHFDVYYDDSVQRWKIKGYEAGGIAPGTQFNVLVNPAQVAACTDRIFADDFD